MGQRSGANRLIDEKSPYLLKHAHNPVDWYPWGNEAFERAEKEQKPVFLSIGYSTCHWCNVMEEESFNDPEVAALLNEVFVSIKVDREERPDIDNIYMSVAVLLNGSGGWPLTIIMTPDRRPFYAGTYFPKESRFGRIGLMELIPRIKKVWTEQRDDVFKSASSITEALKKQTGSAPGGGVDVSVMDSAYGELADNFDAEFAGFGTAPKFPMPHNLSFLLRYWRRSGDEKALDMVTGTLKAMRRGGIFDHLGFGFHRYSTDRQWLVPHFEKMLYDQALLGIAYCEAYQATHEEEFAQTARLVYSYALRDLLEAGGGYFYSAESADSEGEEGRFYVWSEAEVRRALDESRVELAEKYYGVTKEGNFIDPLTGERTGTNILHEAKAPAEVASELGVSEEDFNERLEEARGRLFDSRNRRERPDRDDKVLTDWNGLMIAALAKGAKALGEPGYSDAATAAADFILAKLRHLDGRLIHRWRLGDAAVDGTADDYAFFIWGLLELYEAVFDTKYLKAALELNRIFVEDFWDEKGGGFFFTGSRGEEMLVRQKIIYDSAVPSANSVAMLNLLRLGAMTADTRLMDMAQKLWKAFSGSVTEGPSAHAQLMCAVDFALGPAAEVVVVGDPRGADTEAMLEALRGGFFPNKVVLFRPTDDKGPEIDGITRFTGELESIKGKATAYVCREQKCEMPTTDPAEMLRLLSAV
jgi:uncharacterized protein YyaL (SSP411 family)